MTADVISLRPTFDPVHVELTSPGSQAGKPFYCVDYVERDGCRALMWAGTDYDEAELAAADCAYSGRGQLPVINTAKPH